MSGRFTPVALLLAGCIHGDIDQVDGAYSSGPRAMHCAIDIDTVTRNDWASIDRGLDRARDRGETVELFAHVPGDTVAWDTVEHTLDGAAARGLPFVTYADLAAGHTGAGLAFSFDDDHVGAWMQGVDMFARYGAKLTFFVTRYDRLSDTDKTQLHALHDAGHDIEPHSVAHLRGPEIVERDGLDAYMANEVQPSIDRLVSDGYTVTTYAYPFGSRTDETDHAILGRIGQLRSVALTWGAPAEAPCPL